MSESCECVEVRCCGDNPFNYSLVAGTVYENDQVAIEFDCPPGLRCTPGTYVIPAGRIRFTPTNTESGTLRLLCCESEIVRQVPAGATESEVGVIAQSMANDCARQLARCTAAQTIRFGSTKYSEEVCANGCANQGLLMGWIGQQPRFPSVVFFREGALCLVEGAFASQSSIAAATASAQTFIDNYATSLLFQGVMDCGWWNTEQVCPDSDPPVVIPAFTYFSAISQEDADAQAIAAGCELDCFAALDGVVWDTVADYCLCPICGPRSGTGLGCEAEATVTATCDYEEAASISKTATVLAYEGPETTLRIVLECTAASVVGAGTASVSWSVVLGFDTIGSGFLSAVGESTTDIVLPDNIGAPANLEVSFAVGVFSEEPGVAMTAAGNIQILQV